MFLHFKLWIRVCRWIDFFTFLSDLSYNWGCSHIIYLIKSFNQKIVKCPWVEFGKYQVDFSWVSTWTDEDPKLFKYSGQCLKFFGQVIFIFRPMFSIFQFVDSGDYYVMLAFRFCIMLRPFFPGSDIFCLKLHIEKYTWPSLSVLFIIWHQIVPSWVHLIDIFCASKKKRPILSALVVVNFFSQNPHWFLYRWIRKRGPPFPTLSHHKITLNAKA